MRPVVVAGARPNFVKVAPLLAAMQERGLVPAFVHTGQHYDEALSASLLRDLGLPAPDVELGVGSAPHGAQTAAVMARFESWLEGRGADCVVVCGDVNSTLACALVAVKQGIPVAHLEAGLRSFDRSMPEEVNRVVVDAVATWLLTPSEDAEENLRREGARPERIRPVGNIMVDSLLAALRRRPAGPLTTERMGIDGPFGLVTLHRPALVDDAARLAATMRALGALSEELPLLFPVHPRTQARLTCLALRLPPTLHLVDPLGYVEFVHTEAAARLVLTDSGGVQEETTCLGVPCLTLRDGTERPVTVTAGTNTIVGLDPDRIVPAARQALAMPRRPARPPLWDGRTASRVVDTLLDPPAGDLWHPSPARSSRPAGSVRPR